MRQRQLHWQARASPSALVARATAHWWGGDWRWKSHSACATFAWLRLASLGVAPCASLARVSGYRRDMLAFAGATVDTPVKQANKRGPIARRPTFFDLIIALDGVTQGRTQSITQILANAAIVILASVASVGQ
jgi:hypothetical protein